MAKVWPAPGRMLVARAAPIANDAIGAYGVVAFFQLITLPVEYDASRRAKQQLLRLGLVRGQENQAVSEVLNAVPLTYVAALVAAMLELLKLILIARRLDDRG